MQDGNISLPTDLYPWSADSMLEVSLPDPDSFLKIRETLSRIGVASKQDKTLWQSVHILHRAGRYYLTHFKEMFALDNRPADINYDDIYRRNTIALLLEEWGLCAILSKEGMKSTSMANIKIVSYKSKKEWTLLSKYTMRSDRISR